MKTIARECAVSLLKIGGRHRNWTPRQRQLWTRAFNALQELAGEKVRSYKGGLGVA